MTDSRPPTYGIRQVGDPVLRTPTDPVADPTSAEVGALVDRMVAAMHEADGVGLAANQIGVGLSVFVWDIEDSRGAVVNPRLEVLDRSEEVEEEGCLSVLGLSYPTPRALLVRLTGTAPDGTPVDIEAEGLLARCFQHEVDHLAGRLYVDRLRGSQRRRARRDIEATGR